MNKDIDFINDFSHLNDRYRKGLMQLFESQGILSGLLVFFLGMVWQHHLAWQLYNFVEFKSKSSRPFFRSKNAVVILNGLE